MEVSLPEMVVATFLVLALVLVARFRKQLKGQDIRSYRSICGGLAVLLLVALTRIYSQQGVFGDIPFVSDPVFFQILVWIGIITGATLLVSGVSTWLPLSRAYREVSYERLRRLLLIKRVEQLVAVESRMSVILATTLEYMVELHDLSGGAVYRHRTDGHGLILEATAGPGFEPDEFPREIAVNELPLTAGENQSKETLSRLALRLPQFPEAAVEILPLHAEGKLCGLFVLQAPLSRSDSDQSRVNLKLATDIVARKIVLDRRLESAEHHRRAFQIHSDLSHAVDRGRSLRENMTAVTEKIAAVMPLDYLSLVIAIDGDTVTRFSAGPHGNILKEVNVERRSLPELLRKALDEAAVTTSGDVSKAGPEFADTVLGCENLRSVMILPVKGVDRIVGAVCVAAEKSDAHSTNHRSLLGAVLPVLATLMDDEIHAARLSRREKRSAALNRLLSEIGRGGGLQGILQTAVDLVRDELGLSVARVATFDYGGAFLRSRALALAPEVTTVTPADGHMVLSLMPYHRLIRDTGRVMLVNQAGTDKKISPAEAGQALTEDLQSALLMPVKIGDQVLAVIAGADTRPWSDQQYGDDDLTFAGSVASAVSLAIQLNLSRRGGATQLPAVVNAGSDSPDRSVRRSRLKSSLSGILGSVEMMRAHAGPSADGLEKYLDIIDKSARRINSWIADETTVS